MGGSLSIWCGYRSGNDPIVQLFSSYLEADLSNISFFSGIICGSLCLASCLYGIIFLTPLREHWMHYPFVIFTFCSFIYIAALAAIIRSSGYIAFNVVNDYCTENFSYWEIKHLGSFALQLDVTYTDVERISLCSDSCPCGTVNEGLWGKFANDYDYELERELKNFEGASYNALACPNLYEQY